MKNSKLIIGTFALALCLTSTVRGGEILTPGVVSPPPPPAAASAASGAEIGDDGLVVSTLDQFFNEAVAAIEFLALSLR